MHAVCTDRICDVGAVVHDERTPRSAHLPARRVAASSIARSSWSLSRSWTTSTPPATHSATTLDVAANRRAQVQRSVAERPGHSLAAALWAAFIALLCSRTFVNDAASLMSAIEKCVPVSP